MKTSFTLASPRIFLSLGTGYTVPGYGITCPFHGWPLVVSLSRCCRHARATADTWSAAGDARTALPPTLRAGVEERSTDGVRWSGNECVFHGTGLELPPGPPFFRPAAFTSARRHLRGNIIAARPFCARVLFVEPGAATAASARRIRAAASRRKRRISRPQARSCSSDAARGAHTGSISARQQL